MIHILLYYKVSTSIQDTEGNSSLHLAYDEERVEEAKLLVSQGARWPGYNPQENGGRLNSLSLSLLYVFSVVPNVLEADILVHQVSSMNCDFFHLQNSLCSCILLKHILTCLSCSLRGLCQIFLIAGFFFQL
uniref:Uncharacterized protein n=1 Tax=Oryctolagus cuniculus TaxID=9986 RepID=A0A5F9C2J8_RABIT